MATNGLRLHGWLVRQGPLRVPEITVAFWVLKAMSTALGEATSDYLVHTIAPALAVVLGFIAFVFALVLQFRRGHYNAWTYWFAVAMVGTFGTMAADVLHVGLGVPYPVSTAIYAVVLMAVFVAWQRVEGTLSIHSIDTPRRETFYWAAVVATFAMGTALGDLTAYTAHLGYWSSAILFLGVIAIPAVGFRFLRWNGVFTFWFAYVVTRPLGASVADGLGKPKAVSGLGWGDGWVVLGFGVLILIGVAYLGITRRDVQRGDHRPGNGPPAVPLGDRA
ncbi:MAG: COG4705 family protein [Acidimicrobiales bacterium]